MYIQVIGRLINQRIGVLPRKQRAEQRLGLLALAECPKGTVQRFFRYAQQFPFPQDAPFLCSRGRPPQHLQSRQ